MSEEHPITYRDREILVEGDYIPAEPGIRTYSSGDPGYADSPAEFYINKISDLTGRDITGEFSADDFHKIANLILEGYE